MVELSIEFEPRQGDWDDLLACRPGEFLPDLLCGQMTVRLGTAASTIGTLDPRPYEERGRVPLVLVAVVLFNLLDTGMALLKSRRRVFPFRLADYISLGLERKDDKISIRIVKNGGRGNRLGLRKGRIPRPLLSGDVSAVEFARAIVDASTLIVGRLETERPELVRGDSFWIDIRRKTDDMKSWLVGRIR